MIRSGLDYDASCIPSQEWRKRRKLKRLKINACKCGNVCALMPDVAYTTITIQASWLQDCFLFTPRTILCYRSLSALIQVITKFACSLKCCFTVLWPVCPHQSRNARLFTETSVTYWKPAECQVKDWGLLSQQNCAQPLLPVSFTFMWGHEQLVRGKTVKSS